ncbi:MAG: NUDIX domain-containing protein [Desulfobacca sp.]|uniref:NUDIX domain-containing protein n=1 Tax=Desulfobacca sp. TaxID=2067990 RepID=UPI0040492253
MSKRSAGLLPYRWQQGRLEVFLVHPGGPFWAHRDQGAWSIPKGEYGPEEEPLAAARREFQEETGFPAAGNFLPLTPQRQPSGKIIAAWAVEMDIDPGGLRCNTFLLTWPPHSGRIQEFPEVDRAAWFDLPTAREKIHPGQRGFLEELAARLSELTSLPGDAPA